LDLRGAGELSAADLYVLFREVHALWVAFGYGGEEEEDGEGGGGGGGGGGATWGVREVVSEIQDACGGGGGITREALWRSGMAGTLIGVLASVEEFWAWTNREALSGGGSGGSGSA